MTCVAEIWASKHIFYLAPSGELKLNRALDRETQSTYNLTVKAVDTGSPPNEEDQIIFVTVTDVNDNPPRFVERTYTANVDENKAAREQVNEKFCHQVYRQKGCFFLIFRNYCGYFLIYYDIFLTGCHCSSY